MFIGQEYEPMSKPVASLSVVMMDPVVEEEVFTKPVAEKEIPYEEMPVAQPTMTVSMVKEETPELHDIDILPLSKSVPTTPPEQIKTVQPEPAPEQTVEVVAVPEPEPAARPFPWWLLIAGGAALYALS